VRTNSAVFGAGIHFGANGHGSLTGVTLASNHAGSGGGGAIAGAGGSRLSAGAHAATMPANDAIIAARRQACAL
jgi:hypothetical protein